MRRYPFVILAGLIAWLINSQTPLHTGENDEPLEKTAQSQAPAADHLRAKIDAIAYEQESQSLFVQLKFYNSSSKKLQLVANEFCFKNLNHSYPMLKITESEDAVEIDLSLLRLTRAGIDVLRGEQGVIGRVPKVFEIRPEGHIYFTYSFHFPLNLNDLYDVKDNVPVPHGKKRVRLKLGYATETYEAFFRREFAKGDDTATWQEKIQTSWQKVVTVESEPMDFGARRTVQE